ncbi:MAG: hypothetical protein KIT87_16850 [Anaerolineae bacterium]|nr:hypothetical protein [Anaerolineae bacterium]
MQRLRVRPGGPLRGRVSVDGDKSVSHRAVLLGSLADGPVHIHNFLPATDCWTSVEVVRALGAEVTVHSETHLTVHGQGAWREPSDVLNCGTSGTTVRLLAGLLAGQLFTSCVTGADQLRRRPMRRIVEPLRQMGATLLARANDSLLPMLIRGGGLHGMDYILPVASAQVKLGGPAGRTVRRWTDYRARKSAPTRDHKSMNGCCDRHGADVVRKG